MSDKMTFKKATRDQLKAMIALSGSSGSGKTFTALRLARGLVGPQGRIGLIDTEHGRSQIYAQEFDFETLDLEPPFTPERYIRAIEAGEEAGFDALIVDSGTHEWAGKGGILEQHDLMEGNSYTNWAVLTPRHTAFLDRLTRCKVHLFVTLRGKDEYVLEQNEKGKQQPKKVGLGPVQRAGIEYEFMVSFMLDQIRHTASVMKDNTHLFEGVIEVLTEEHGRKLADWCSKGVDPKERARPLYRHLDALVTHHEKKAGEATVLEMRKAMSLHDADRNWLEAAIKKVEAKYGKLPDPDAAPLSGNGKTQEPTTETPPPAAVVEPASAPDPDPIAEAEKLAVAVDPPAVNAVSPEDTPSVGEWDRPDEQMAIYNELQLLRAKLPAEESDTFAKAISDARTMDSLRAVLRKLVERIGRRATPVAAMAAVKAKDDAPVQADLDLPTGVPAGV